MTDKPDVSRYLPSKLAAKAEAYWEKHEKIYGDDPEHPVAERLAHTLKGIEVITEGNLTHRGFEDLVHHATLLGGAEVIHAYERVGQEADKKGMDKIGQYGAQQIVEKMVAEQRAERETGLGR